MKDKTASIMRLLAFSDSAFPVGTFAFSCGLESAVDIGAVCDAASLEEYVRDMTRQAAYTDGVAALHAYRACTAGDYEGILLADDRAVIGKMNAEARMMTRRMGRKLAELAQCIFSDAILGRFAADIADGRTPGSYPVTQAVVFAVCGISEHALFCSHQYGVANMILGAALRCLRVSHYDTQRIAFRLGESIGELYADVNRLGVDDMNAFCPYADIIASLHEKGTKRMFMN